MYVCMYLLFYVLLLAYITVNQNKSYYVVAKLLDIAYFQCKQNIAKHSNISYSVTDATVIFKKSYYCRAWTDFPIYHVAKPELFLLKLSETFLVRISACFGNFQVASRYNNKHRYMYVHTQVYIYSTYRFGNSALPFKKLPCHYRMYTYVCATQLLTKFHHFVSFPLSLFCWKFDNKILLPNLQRLFLLYLHFCVKVTKGYLLFMAQFSNKKRCCQIYINFCCRSLRFLNTENIVARSPLLLFLGLFTYLLDAG